MSCARIKLATQVENALSAGTYVITSPDGQTTAEWEDISTLVKAEETVTTISEINPDVIRFTDEDGGTTDITINTLEANDINIPAVTRTVTISSGGELVFVDSNPSPEGLKYGANYSGTMTDLSLVPKIYVDSVVQGLSPKEQVLAATTTNITLSGGQTIDGITVGEGDRVLVKNQTATEENGIYVASGTAWTRADDADTWDELVSAFTFVSEGTANGDTAWLSTVDAGGTLGTTSVVFTQFYNGADVTASNENTGGIGVFKQKSGTNLEFRGINDAGSGRVSVTLDGGTNEIRLDVVEGSVNHDNLSGFVANEHINHSLIDIIAGTGLTGGGAITGDVTLNADIKGLESLTPSQDALVYYNDTSGNYEQVTLGTGLTLTPGTDTLAFAHLGLESLADPNDDRIAFWDDSAGAFAWLDASTGIDITGTNISVANNTTTQKIEVYDADTLIGTRKGINYTVTGGATVNITDDAIDDVVNVEIGTSGLVSEAFKTITDGVTNIVADSPTDVLTIESGNTILALTLENDGASGDRIIYTVQEGNIEHDNLSGFVANEHIDHSSVDITPGEGLTGGGNITTSRTIDLDFTREQFDKSSGTTVTVSGTLPTDTALIRVTRNGLEQEIGTIAGGANVEISGSTLTFDSAFGPSNPTTTLGSYTECVLVTYGNG